MGEDKEDLLLSREIERVREKERERERQHEAQSGHAGCLPAAT
jgi:hypothetical protein